MRTWITFLALALAPITSYANESRCFELFALTEAPSLEVRIHGINGSFDSARGGNYDALLSLWSAEAQALLPSGEYPEIMDVVIQNYALNPSHAQPGGVTIHTFEDTEIPMRLINEQFRENGKAVYIHEYLHVLLSRNYGNWSPRLREISDLWLEMEDLHRLLKINEARKQQIVDSSKELKAEEVVQMILKLHNANFESAMIINRYDEVKQFFNRYAMITVPYEEVLADLAVVMANRDLSVMEKAILKLPSAVNAEFQSHGRDFAVDYNPLNWETSDVHIMFSPVRSHIGKLIEKLGWDKSRIIFDAVLKASIHRIEFEMAHPEEQGYALLVRNHLYIQAINDAINGIPFIEVEPL